MMLGALAVLLAAPGAQPAAGAVLRVDDDTQQCRAARFADIQSAVIAAAEGDTIEICPGTYPGGVLIDKPRVRLTALRPGTAHVVPMFGELFGFAVIADGVTIRGLAIHGFNLSTTEGGGGQAIVTGILEGVGFIAPTTRVSLEQNTIYGNVVGIQLEGSQAARVRGNRVEDNLFAGILLNETSRAAVVQNRVHRNGGVLGGPTPGEAGIRLVSSTGNRIEENVARGNTSGIYLERSGRNVLDENRVERSTLDGVVLCLGSSENLVLENRVIRNAASGILACGGSDPALRNAFVGNSLNGNTPFDLKDEAPPRSNRYAGNACNASHPAGLCARPPRE